MKKLRKVMLALFCIAFVFQQSISISMAENVKKADGFIPEKVQYTEIPKYQSEAKSWSPEKLKEFKENH